MAQIELRNSGQLGVLRGSPCRNGWSILGPSRHGIPLYRNQLSSRYSKMSSPYWTKMHMGGCQNCGPFLGPYYSTAPNI